MSYDEDDPTPFAVIAQPLGMYAGELLVRSREYFDAAVAVAGAYPETHIHPKYYLLAHSVELALKAFLVGHGETKRRLKETYGHALPKLVERATGKGLPEIEHFDVLVRHLWALNSDFGLRYPVGYVQAVLRFDQAAEIVKALLDVTNRAVVPVYLRDWLRYLSKYQDRYVEWSD